MTNYTELGDFTSLAKNYSESRPDYCPNVLRTIARCVGKDFSDIDCADVGAGTGIWCRMLNSLGVKSAIAVEPNEEMIKFGSNHKLNENIRWIKGSAEETKLAEGTIDWLSMASSFHWTDHALALEEFSRVLRTGGLLSLLWNPRRLNDAGVQGEIERFIKEIKPDLKRVSSGYSQFTEELYDMLSTSQFFENVIYIEGQHSIDMSRERYIKVWRSVNDIQSQLGPRKFARLMEFIEVATEGQRCISTKYVTRAWVAFNKK